MEALCEVIKPAFAATPFRVSLGAVLSGLLKVFISGKVSDQHSGAVLLLHEFCVSVNWIQCHGNLLVTTETFTEVPNLLVVSQMPSATTTSASGKVRAGVGGFIHTRVKVGVVDGSVTAEQASSFATDLSLRENTIITESLTQ